MAVLKHNPSGRRVTLAARSILGRAQGCAVRLTSTAASGEHAVLFWDGAKWSLRDLGSRNGTFVAGRRLGPAERCFVDVNEPFTFGDDAECWVLEEAGPPTASARHVASGEVCSAEEGLIVLPEPNDPRVTLSEDRDGQWLIETDGPARPAADGETIEAGGLWTLRIPPADRGSAVPTTTSPKGKDKLAGTTVLRFDVSRDEEFVKLSLVHGGAVTSLGARAHHDLLLALGRARLSDVERGLPLAEQGWLYVEDLLSMLRLDLHHFNVNVFRARQHLARAGMIDAGSIVERRSTTRQIRLGTTAIEIEQP
ncbi:MAG: FHA domain-containing protein [Polyangiaceae bacterium]